MDKNILNDNISKLADHFEKANFAEYVQLMTRPWKLFWFNFLAGVFRGLGIAIGMTVIFAVVVYVLVTVMAPLLQIPIIGSYIANLVDFVNNSVQNGLRQ